MSLSCSRVSTLCAQKINNADLMFTVQWGGGGVWINLIRIFIVSTTVIDVSSMECGM